MGRRTQTYSCKDCGFYDKCPEDYLCPALECLINVYMVLGEELYPEEGEE